MSSQNRCEAKAGTFDGVESLRAVPRQERSSQSITAILDAAEKLAETAGLDDMTVAQVALDAGVSAGKVYYWFEDKQALIAAVRARSHERVETFLRGMLEEVDIDDASGLIEHYVREFASYMIDHPTALDLLNQPRSGGTTDPFRNTMCDLVVGLLAARITDIGPIEARKVARNLVNVMITLTADVVAANAEEQDAMTTEMVYLLYAYLHSRYPHVTDHVWSNPDHPLQPARAVDGGLPRSRPMYPASFSDGTT